MLEWGRYYENLRRLLLEKMNGEGYTIAEMSIMCEISYNEMRNILNGKKVDLKMSTFVTICQNMDLNYMDIFECSNAELFTKMIHEFILTNGKESYKIH